MQALSKLRSSIVVSLTGVIAAMLVTVGSAVATERPGDVPQEAAIVEHLDDPIDLSLQFRREDGSNVTLAQLMLENRPLIIAPVYFECPRLCQLTQSGLLKAINATDLILGKDYTVASVSFNSEEKPEEANAKAEKYRSLLTNPEFKPKGWSFLVGSTASTASLMSRLGFGYKKDGTEFIHAAVIIVIMPGGKISRYPYGIEFPERDFRFSLVEAARGRIGSTVDKILFFCFRYDHFQGKYTLAIWNITRFICALGFVGLMVFLVRMYLNEKRVQVNV